MNVTSRVKTHSTLGAGIVTARDGSMLMVRKPPTAIGGQSLNIKTFGKLCIRYPLAPIDIARSTVREPNQDGQFW
jgi:hypothetical protein